MNPPGPGSISKNSDFCLTAAPRREETPISKYLANLEKRRTIFHSSKFSPTKELNFGGIAMKLNFNEDTFSEIGAEQSLLQHSPPQESRRILPSSASVFKRRRTSFLFKDDEDEDTEVLHSRIS